MIAQKRRRQVVSGKVLLLDDLTASRTPFGPRRDCRLLAHGSEMIAILSVQESRTDQYPAHLFSHGRRVTWIGVHQRLQDYFGRTLAELGLTL